MYVMGPLMIDLSVKCQCVDTVTKLMLNEQEVSTFSAQGIITRLATLYANKLVIKVNKRPWWRSMDSPDSDSDNIYNITLLSDIFDRFTKILFSN